MPAGDVATTAEGTVATAERLGYPVAVKAQVRVEGRGKAGGIRLASDAAEAGAAAEAILGMDISGHLVERVWVERASEIAAERYVSFTLDRSARLHLGCSQPEPGSTSRAWLPRSPRPWPACTSTPSPGPGAAHRLGPGQGRCPGRPLPRPHPAPGPGPGRRATARSSRPTATAFVTPVIAGVELCRLSRVHFGRILASAPTASVAAHLRRCCSAMVAPGWRRACCWPARTCCR